MEKNNFSCHQYDLSISIDAILSEEKHIIDRSVYYGQPDGGYDCAGTFGSAGTFGGTFGTIGTWGCCC